MSVDYTVYAVLGVVIRDEDTMNYVRDIINQGDPDRFQEPHCDITVIKDNMCGKYIVIGELLSNQNSYGDGAFTEISPSYMSDEHIWSVRDKITDYFPHVPTGFVGLMIFSHFS